jgi:hypothetical protein
MSDLKAPVNPNGRQEIPEPSRATKLRKELRDAKTTE